MLNGIHSEIKRLQKVKSLFGIQIIPFGNIYKEATSKESEKDAKKLAGIFDRMMKEYGLNYQEIIAGASANGGCFFLC